MEDFIIRPALLEDMSDVQQLSLQAFQHEYDHGFNRHLNLHWPRSAGAQALFRRLIEQEDSLRLVAVRGTETVGYLAGHLGDVGPQHVGGRTALLRGLFVSAHLRRRGIGEQLVRRFLAWARDQQVAGISVAVAPMNEPALALYRKLGGRDQTLILALSQGHPADAQAAARG
jgi:ribosomal protein S18 acetylase RimI-like enzyme